VDQQYFSSDVARLLRDALKDLTRQIAVSHWDFYRAFRVWMSRITKVDAFYIGIFHGQDRILFTYHYDGNDLVNAPGSIKVRPGGPSDWVRSRQRTYRYSFDGGVVLNQTIRFGDVTRASADALVSPLMRAPSETLDVLGVASIQTYTPNTYGDEDVAAFEWLCGVVARLLMREEENKQAARTLSESSALSPDSIVTAVVRDVGSMRWTIDKVLSAADITVKQCTSVLEQLSAQCARLQAETAELLLDAHRVSDTRFRSLTPRERDVAQLLMKDLSNAEIGSQLNIAENTIKRHVGAILRKYGAKQRASVIFELRQYFGNG
jgi:DNA-binding NarL/FixJ family response regulator